MKQCGKCKENKTEDNFGKNSNCKDGLGSRCKKCVSLYDESRVKTTVVVEYKICIICNENKLKDEFNKCKTSSTGLHSYCKICLKKSKKLLQQGIGQNNNKQINTIKYFEKICPSCNKIKPNNAFRVDQNRKGGLAYRCNQCSSDSQKQWRSENLNIIQQKDRARWKKRQEKLLPIFPTENKCLTCNKIKIIKNFYCYSKFTLEFSENCIECIIKIRKEKKKIHRRHNRVIFRNEINAKRRDYRKKRIAKDPAFKLRHRISGVIRHALFDSNSSKYGQSILAYLQYTIQELKHHFESRFEFWMTWENWGKYIPSKWDDLDHTTWTWNIDHIVPQSILKYTSMTDENFKKCWALENLRPLRSKDNILKSNKIIGNLCLE